MVNGAFLWFSAVFDPSQLTVWINCSFFYIYLNTIGYFFIGWSSTWFIYQLYWWRCWTRNCDNWKQTTCAEKANNVAVIPTPSEKWTILLFSITLQNVDQLSKIFEKNDSYNFETSTSLHYHVLLLLLYIKATHCESVTTFIFSRK